MESCGVGVSVGVCMCGAVSVLWLMSVGCCVYSTVQVNK